MKKIISLFLALIMLFLINTVVSSAIDSGITVAPTLDHVRKGDVAYYPIKFDMDKANSTYVDFCESSAIAPVSTHIELSYLYEKESLAFVNVLPSETLYNLGGTVKVTEHGTVDSIYDYFNIEIDFTGTEGLAEEYFFNIKFNVLQENFITSHGIANQLLHNNAVFVDEVNETWKDCVWLVTDRNGESHDLSKKIQTSYVMMTDFIFDYNQLLITDYEPFIPPEGDIGSFDEISIDADSYHARIGDYAYFPLAYDCNVGYRSYVGSDKGAKTKIVLPFVYMPDLLEPVEATPSEVLYGIGGTAEIIEYGKYVQKNDSVIDYFYVEVNFEGYEGIADGTILFNVKCKVLSEEFFDEYGTYKIGIFDNFHMIEKGTVNYFKTCSWIITQSDGMKNDVSSCMNPPMFPFYDELDKYEDFVLNDYKPFIPPVTDTPSTSLDKIVFSADSLHVRKGDYAYFPVYYNCETPYRQYADKDGNSSTRIILPFFYNDNLLEPLDVIESEQLYSIGGTVEIIKTDKFVYGDVSVFPYIYVEINFDGCAGIENGVIFNIKFKVKSENFFDEYGRLDQGGLLDEFYIVDSGNISKFPYSDWKITKSDGTVKDISSYVAPESFEQFEGTTYEDLLIKDYEPFFPPELEEAFDIIGSAQLYIYNDVKYIIGLQPKLTKAVFQKSFMFYDNVIIEYKMTTKRYLGTGSTVTVRSANTGEVIDTYVILIYGDVDGNAAIDATDTLIIFNSISGENAPLDGIQKLAANINGPRMLVNSSDKSYMESVVKGTMIIDQVTGKAVTA